MPFYAPAAISAVLLSATVATAQGAPPPASPPASVPASQNPSPMVEHTRRHERLVPTPLPGVTMQVAGPGGKMAELYLPPKARTKSALDLVVHFHGAAWLAQQAAAMRHDNVMVVVLNLGSGSGAYDRAFTDPAVFDSLLTVVTREAARHTAQAVTLRRVVLSGFSAGHGAIRRILREPRHVERVDGVLLLDGMHTSYIPEGRVLANGGVLDTSNLTALAAFARAALRGDKRMLISHSEIFPGTFASTTETADWLVQSLGVRRKTLLREGPRGLQQLSEVRRRGFTLMGFAGNSAPDHIDQFHAMPELLARVRR